MVAELSEDIDRPARVWAALGSPCASVYVPFIVPPPSYRQPAPVAGVLADEVAAKQFEDLRFWQKPSLPTFRGSDQAWTSSKPGSGRKHMGWLTIPGRGRGSRLVHLPGRRAP